MADSEPTLLIVEDDLDVADMLKVYFQGQGYRVLCAHLGEEGILACQANLPNLIILDIRLPDIDGFEVALRLRSQRKTKDIPIIFLTEKRTRQDRITGLRLGADDYITKPFDFQELRLRVRNAIHSGPLENLVHPVTGLPDTPLVDERLEEWLQNTVETLVVIAIIHLTAFRDRYGFLATDDALRATALMVNNAVREVGGVSDFIGHLNPDQLILLTTSADVDLLAERITTRLEQSLEYFYPANIQDTTGEAKPRLRIRLGFLKPGVHNIANIQELKTALNRQIQ